MATSKTMERGIYAAIEAVYLYDLDNVVLADEVCRTIRDLGLDDEEMVSRARAECWGFRAYDPLTEWTGPRRRTTRAAREDAEAHDAGCAAQGGYGSAIVIRPDGEGFACDLDGRTVWPSYGRSSGAVRWS